MRSQPRRAFCAGAFLMDFLAGYSVLPIQRSILSRPHPLPAPWLPTPSEKIATNAPENIVRMKRGKIVTHYTISPLFEFCALRVTMFWQLVSFSSAPLTGR